MQSENQNTPTSAELFNTASNLLLNPFDLDPVKISRVLDNVMGKSVDYADLYFQYGRSEGWALEEGIVKSGSFNIDQGVGFRALSLEKTAFAYSDEISIGALDSAASAIKAIGAGHSGSEALVASGDIKTEPLYPAIDPLASVSESALHS